MSALIGRGTGVGAPGIGQLPGQLAGFGARICSFLIDFVKIETGEPIGFGMALLRQICLTVALGSVTIVIGFLIVPLNYLWPLWDPKQQTIADKIVKAVVVRIDDAST